MDNNHQLKDKTILLVNTGSLKKRFILQRLKKLELKIVVLNKEKNWASLYADHWISADTYNHNEVLQGIQVFLANNPDVKIDGAITFWEDDVPLLAKICKEFKLTGNSLEAAVNTRDKFRMQEILKQCGQAHIRGRLLKSSSDLETAIKEIGFPAVIKPLYGSDSQFVVYVSNEDEAKDAYNYVRKSCTPEYDPIYKYNKKLFVYQEFIDGHEFSLECYCQYGVPHIVGIHEKTAMDLPFFMETGDYLPPRINTEQKNELIRTTEAALIILGVKDSLAHVEIKLTKTGPKIIEVASRLGGEYTHKNIEQVYGVDLIKTGCEIALGINTDVKPAEPKKYIMGKFFIPKTSGVINKISGFDDIKKDERVLDYYLHKKVGDAVSIPPDGYENIGWVLAEGNSYAEVESTIANAFEKVRIEVSPFRSYSSIGKTLRKNRFSSALLAKGSDKIEKIRQTTGEDIKNLHVGIACNIYESKEEENGAVEHDLMSIGKNIEKTLKERGYKITFFDFNNLPKVFNELKRKNVDLVFNVCERINNSSLLEPHAAAILDALQIPYTGSNPFTLGLCIDKIRVKKLLAYHNIPTPRWDYAYEIDDEIRDDLRYPLIVKPGNTDNSIGITNESVVANKQELDRQLRKVIMELGRPALVEEYIEGDEYDVTIIGSDEENLRVLPLSRSIFKEMPAGYWHIYPFDAKWSESENNPYNKIIVQRPPKNIDKKLEALISEIALDTYNILDCHDYGRVEIRVDEYGNPYVLELNPNPSIDINDCVPASAELVGMDYGKFLEEIIKMTIRRYKDRPPYYHLQANLI